MPSGARKNPFRLGLIVNPIAGLGGAVALKGTDGAARHEALRRGARPMAAARAARAVARLDPMDLLVAGGAMGEDVARQCGRCARVVTAPAELSGAHDTVRAAEEMRCQGASLVLFAGGDGTARDVFAGLGDVPMLGIPTGVKMHSAVFATSPENAGLLANAAARDTVRLQEAELLDLDETLLERGIVAPRLHGVALVPVERRLLQQAKARAGAPGAELEGACGELAASLDGLTLIGPGTTTQRVLAHLGLQGTLLGVDAVHDGVMVGRDLTEAQILRLIEGHPARLVMGVVGGQGFLFGRGNQQLSPAVLTRIGPDRLTVIAGAEKLAMLQAGTLYVDTGDPALDAKLAGYIRVRTAPGRTMLCKLTA